ncbi:hypothetical protein K4A83_14540 [Spirulina subsalsa FACHB-351]|uniref:DRBM domain-containing protein n=1 Tax=Spirulina subsalsa FACHB-351 TaxID=234711 RepID=A0ABT3L8J2_9CYAN|nr:hypothetical protein [Spirulina subsalsa]MCW6037482.1 hypothetical protein [Spirulina subsalsa FACHB-351]
MMLVAEFRNYYPQGGLISELVQFKQGKYVVRALVQVEGVTLATGHGAADTVEMAEDQARSRALALLMPTVRVNQSSSPTPAPIASVVRHPEQNGEGQVHSAPVPKSAPIAPPEPALEPNPPRVESLPVTTVSPVLEPLPEREPESVLPPVEALEEDSVEMTPPFEVEAEPDLAVETSPPAPSTPTVNLSESPMDFSDVIAQTNIELKRLGWTNEQGRDYLLQTYGKRSRQLLSDNELVEFLDHLRSQP